MAKDRSLHDWLLSLCVGAVCLCHDEMLDLVRVGAVVAAAVALVWPRRQRWAWLALAALFVIELAVHRYTAANHLYLWTAFITLIAVDARRSDGTHTVGWACGWLLIVVFGCATLHKLASPYFMSGGLLAEHLLAGRMFPGLWARFAVDGGALMEAYPASLEAAQRAWPPGPSPLATGSGLWELSRVLSRGIIIAEAGATVILVVSMWRGWDWLRCPTIWAFTASAYLFRSENLFFALLIFIGWTSLERRDGPMGLVSAVLIVLLLVDLWLGIRPGWLGAPLV